MALRATISSFLRNLFHRRTVEAELEAEISSYIEEKADRNAAGGMSRGEALRHAKIDAGGPQQVKEKVLAEKAGYWLQTFWQDVRYAARTVVHKPGMLLACVLTFAVGIGANTAIFSMVNGLVLRPIDAYRPERLTFFVARLGSGWANGFSLPDFLDIREQSREAFSDVAGIQQVQREGLNFQGRSQTFWVDYVSTNFFSLMGVRPTLGAFLQKREGLTLISLRSCSATRSGRASSPAIPTSWAKRY
jgi:MacB-like periplasmic core domain